MENENKELPAKIQYSIWDTRTEANHDHLKVKNAKVMESSLLKTKTTKDQK